MQVPQIRMESTMARISIEQENGTLEIEQKPAQMSIEQPKADMQIERTKGKLTIDQTQAWEDMNLMSTMRLIETKAAEGRQALSEGTARRAEQGTQLMRIEDDSNPIYSQAIANGSKGEATIGFKYMPSVFSVKLHYESGTTHINFVANKPNIDVEIQKPDVTFNRGGVNVNIAQYNDLQIDYVNLFPEQRV